MRNRTLPLTLVAALAAGCAFTSREVAIEDRVAQAEAAFTGAVRSATELRKSGKLSDSTWAATQKKIAAGDETFEAIHAVGDAGDTEGAEDLLSVARRITRDLIAVRTGASP